MSPQQEASKPEKVEVGEKFFFNVKAQLRASSSHEALKMFASGYNAALKLEGNLPIVLDTNILLGYYGMSNKEKKKLLAFFQKYNDRIYITRQVELEYLRNRLGVIKTDFFEPLSKVAPDYNTMKAEIAGKLNDYVAKRRKILSHDFPDLWDELSKIRDEINKRLHDSKYHDEASKKIQTVVGDYKNIEYEDELLERVSKFNLVDEISSVGIEFLKKQFETFLADFKSGNQSEKTRKCVPGCGDNKEDASGDYIIFNEMLQLIKSKGMSCIFLTNDVTKGDWIQKDSKAHVHYLEHSYMLTGQVIYILHAERALQDISFENIHNIELEIIKATYGTGPEKQLDVTFALRDKIINNKLTLIANNNIAGDPDVGTPKTLEILYRLRDVEGKSVYREGETVEIG